MSMCLSPSPSPSWVPGGRRGGYARLETKARTALGGLGSLSPWVEEESSFEDVARSGPPREVAMVYDVLEVAGGGGGVGASLRAQGYIALNVDLAMSQHFDMQDDVPLHWVIHMIERQRVGVVFLEPPCADFSGALHPATRSYELALQSQNEPVGSP